MFNKGKRKHTSLYDDGVSSDDDTSSISPAEGSERWRKEFNKFLQGDDELGEGMTLVQYWRVSDLLLWFVNWEINLCS
jgi:hypothetical protein